MYNELINSGVCREQARIVLPQAMYTTFYWKINMHNLMHYLQLRMAPGAQQEIRDYANKIYELVQPLAPLAWKAFADFKLNAVKFSHAETHLLREMIGGSERTFPTRRYGKR